MRRSGAVFSVLIVSLRMSVFISVHRAASVEDFVSCRQAPDAAGSQPFALRASAGGLELSGKRGAAAERARETRAAREKPR
jgi:hypothetical protein